MSATLKGEVRKKLGSRDARKLRLQGKLPASIQGEGKDDRAIALDEDEFLAARRHHQHLFDIELGGDDVETALVRELQWSTLGQRIVHVEFRRVVRGQKTEVEVELSFVGHPKDGVLNHLMTHVTVMALPSEIPDQIEVRVDGLEIGHPLVARDLELPEGVELAVDPDAQVASVATVRAEPEPTEGEGEEGVEGEAAAAPEAAGAEEDSDSD